MPFDLKRIPGWRGSSPTVSDQQTALKFQADGHKETLVRFDNLLKEADGANYDHILNSKDSYYNSMPTYFQQRFQGYYMASPSGKIPRDLRAFDKANPPQVPPWVTDEIKHTPDPTGKGLGKYENVILDKVSKFAMAKYKLDESVRIDNRSRVESGQTGASTKKHVVQVDEQTLATFDDNGLPNLVSLQELNIKEQAESLGLTMGDFHGGVFEKSVDVQTPMGKMVHTYIYPGNGTMSPSELKETGFRSDYMGNPYQVEINPGDAIAKERRDQMTEQSKLLQDVSRDYARFSDGKAWDKVDKEDTRSSKLLQEFMVNLDQGDEEFALQQLGNQTGGVWLIAGRKDDPWKTHFWGSGPTWVKGKYESLVHLPGQWQEFKSKDGFYPPLYVNPQGHVMDMDRMNDPAINKQRGTSGKWYENIDEAQAAIGSATAEELGMTDRTGREMAASLKPSMDDITPPEDYLQLSANIPVKTTTELSNKAAAKKLREIVRVSEDSSKFPEYIKAYRAIDNGLGSLSEEIKSRVFKELVAISSSTTATITELFDFLLKPGGKFRGNLPIKDEQALKKVRDYIKNAVK